MNEFTPKDWSDSPSTSTPIAAAELERIEMGVANAQRIWQYPITSGRARAGTMIKSGWKFLEADKWYFYPVPYFGTVLGGTFGVDKLGVHLRGDEASGTVRVGLWDDSNGGLPGVPQAQASATSTSGWKELDITNVTGLPYGWYWHGCMVSIGMDVHGGVPVAMFDASTMEGAVREDSLTTVGLVTSSTHSGSWPTNPAVVGDSGPIPRVGVQFV